MALDAKWTKTVDDGVTNAKWDEYDGTIQAEVAAYNLRFSKTAADTGYNPVDWTICKAMLWVESGGPTSKAWKNRVLQIGNHGDPGYTVLKKGADGSDLIMSPELAADIKGKSIDDPVLNIRAGIAYLFTRLAQFEFKSVPDLTDTSEHSYTVVPGDSLERIAGKVGTTVSVLEQMNPGKKKVIHPKDVLKYKKASIQRVIQGWKEFTPDNIARLYNVGDASYAAKLHYVLDLFKKLKRTAATSTPTATPTSDPVTTIPVLP